MIYGVSGFMRSGTSMLCRALEAGGMTVVRSEARDEFGKIHSDAYYSPNAGGLYEASLQEMREIGWPRQYDGMVVKAVAPFIKFLAPHAYRVVFMRRDAEEIRQSYAAAFGKHFTTAQIEATVSESLSQLRNRRDVADIIEVEYASMVKNPLAEFTRLADNAWPFDPIAAAKIVDPAQYRFRLERLTAGL